MKRYITSSLSRQDRLASIQKNNPVYNDYATWIRTEDDIHDFVEVYHRDGIVDDDFTKEMAEQAIHSGEIKVFSSYPIRPGVFVSPSYMEAEAYAGNGKVYSKVVSLDDVSWIDITQGQYTPDILSADDLDSSTRSMLIDAIDFIVSEYSEDYDEDGIIDLWMSYISETDIFDDVSILSDDELKRFGHELYEDYR